MNGPSRKTAALVLAHGEGTCAGSPLSLMGKPLVLYTVDACRKAGADPILVEAGAAAGTLRARFGSAADWVEELRPAASEKLGGFRGNLLAVRGCMPFLTAGILKQMIRHHGKTGAAVTLMAAPEERVQHGRKGKSAGGSAFPPCVFRSEKVVLLLSGPEDARRRLAAGPAEWIRILAGRNERIETLRTGDPAVLTVVNDLKGFSEARTRLQARVIERLFEKGVAILDPASVVIEPDVRIAPGAVVHPFSVLTGKTVIGKDCVIGPCVRIEDTRIGDGCRVEFAVLEHRKIDAGKTVGPFAFMTSNRSVKE